MKIMSRDFTRTEKVLIVVLILILLVLAYYQFVDKDVRQSIVNAESEAEMLQVELDAAEKRLVELRSTQAALDKLEAEGKLSWMPSYNGSKAEVAFLNEILADTLQYSITFSGVTRNGAQIRRDFTLQYQTVDYAAAQEIMDRLCAGKNRCLVGDVKSRIAPEGTVTINASATFYETMVGGTPDAGLPEDGATANQ